MFIWRTTELCLGSTFMFGVYAQLTDGTFDLAEACQTTQSDSPHHWYRPTISLPCYGTKGALAL
jgi:hypothetical protein